jgi:glycosyltransferase involved in cell wall biosynthesis
MSELVSIVLPTYNRADLILESVESCLAQTYSNIELLVVDDGSTDHTPDVLRQVAQRDSRVRYLRQDNARLPAALNTGFRAARGELWTWTSDDNAYQPEAIQVMAGYLRDHPDIGLVYCDYEVINDRGERVKISHRKPPETILKKNPIGACFLYRRSVAERVGEYDTQTFLAEDYDYWVRISRVAPIAHLPGVAPYRYRWHESSLSSTRGAEVELQAARVRARYARTERERRAIMAAGYCEAASELRWRGHYLPALQHYFQAIRLHAVIPFAYSGLVMTCGMMLCRRKAG